MTEESKKVFINFYLDYLNNYLTWLHMSESYGMHPELTRSWIETGRGLHIKSCETSK